MSSQPPTSENAYEAPQTWAFKDEAYPAQAAPPPGYRPGGLTAVCIIGIVLGAMGLMTGFGGVGMALFGNQVQQFSQKLGTTGGPQEMMDIQAQMNAQSTAIFNRYRLVNLAVAVAQLAVAAALLAGGIRALRLKEAGRKMLWAACAAAIAFELFRAVPHVLMQLENMAMMEDYLPRMMEASAPGAQGAQIAEFAKMMTKFSMIMGWVIFAGWLVLKLAFFGVGVYYLGQPKVKALYAKGA